MIELTKLEDTNESRIFMIKGRPTTFTIYLVPLDDLKYNIQNGRIASYITEYEDTEGRLPEDNATLNAIIEKFIVESNENSFKKTKNNILRFDQLEPAVVLSSGIVVDGNRRFSALRQLQREGYGSKFGYIKTAVIDEKNYSTKEIKTLELNLQHARDSRIDYNPIERLVDIYRDLLLDGGQFTIDEYAHETDEPIQKIRDEVEVTKLLVQYLEFINQPLKFHIARLQKLDGPLREVFKILKSNKVDDDRRDDIQELLFANILSLDGDITRKIRDLKKITEDPIFLDKMLEESEDYLDDLNDHFHDESVREDIEKSNTINIPENIASGISKITEDTVEKKKLSTAKKQPIEYISKSLNALESIDIESVHRMNTSDTSEFKKYLNEITNKLEYIEESLKL